MMKARWIITLAGSLGLLCSSAVLAHDVGPAFRVAGPGLNGGVAVWADPCGRVQYAANLAVGVPLFE